jgi:glutamate N-acetyltransferase/amino-acid N-acetyltransferase
MSNEVHFQEDTNGLSDPKGYLAAAVSADIRGNGGDRLDTGIVYSLSPCAAAGVFTKNAVKAAPVLDCERILGLGTPIHGIVANSGNANACTGTQGIGRLKRLAVHRKTDFWFVQLVESAICYRWIESSRR